jgi:hypothetical protein
MPLARPLSFKLSEEYTQLALALDLPEVELENIPQDQARLISEAGRSAFFALKGKPDAPAWFGRFEMLVESGWTWRQACYIAWASTPLEGREPRTQEDLATKYLSLSSDRAISLWKKKNPAIEGMIGVMQTLELWEHRADSFMNLINGMKKSGEDYKFFNHLKLYMEMTGDYVPLNQVAAVLKRKADGGAHELDESTLDDLAQGAEELAGMFYPTPDPSPNDPSLTLRTGLESGESETE